MEPFATTFDLAARWRTLMPTEESRAEALLLDATAYLTERLASAGVEIVAGDEVQTANLKAVCCSMVQRVMAVSEDSAGISQSSQTAGPFSQSNSYANPGGDMYLTSAEQRKIGIKRQRAFAVRPKIGGADDAW